MTHLGGTGADEDVTTGARTGAAVDTVRGPSAFGGSTRGGSALGLLGAGGFGGGAVVLGGVCGAPLGG